MVTVAKIISFGGYIISFWGNVLIGGKYLLGVSLSLYGEIFDWGKIINFWGVIIDNITLRLLLKTNRPNHLDIPATLSSLSATRM